ncbi:ABC transporter substrate-binding protein [Lacisediminihabitans sp. FW035]
MHKTAVRSTIAVGMVFAAGIALAGCASASPSSSSAPTAAAGAVDLSGVCPATVTIQTDWNPEADHGHLYQLLGPNPVINADKKSVSGDLYASGKSTGVKVEIRSGGPAIGFSTVSSEMYKDKDITLGYVSTDEAVQLSASLPTTAVFAENDISPQMIMWDPATYPKVKTIKELATALKDDGGVVRYFQGAAYMGYLQGSGILPEAQTDGAYDGTPAKFVTAKGKDGQQGFATAEPYIYQNEVSAWGKPVDFQLINDTGYPIYPEAMSVRSSELSTLSPCLKKLVPVLQQADVDYISKPAATNKLVADLVTAFNNGWVYSEKVANFGVSQMKKLKIASNGSNAYVGDMEEARIQKVIDIDTPLFTASGSAPKSGLKATDLFTNEFLDTSIGF